MKADYATIIMESSTDVNNFNDVTLPGFYDTIHAYGFTDYVGYGGLTVNCLNSHYICLTDDFYPYSTTDDLQEYGL